MIFQQPPPFEPTVIQAEALTNIAFMFAEILILCIFMILIIYLYKKVRDYLPLLVVFLFSLLIGIEAITHIHTHFSPFLEIFFLLFQSSFFIMSSINQFERTKQKRGLS